MISMPKNIVLLSLIFLSCAAVGANNAKYAAAKSSGIRFEVSFPSGMSSAPLATKKSRASCSATTPPNRSRFSAWT
jgi:hypothetical protein